MKKIWQSLRLLEPLEDSTVKRILEDFNQEEGPYDFKEVSRAVNEFGGIEIYMDPVDRFDEDTSHYRHIPIGVKKVICNVHEDHDYRNWDLLMKDGGIPEDWNLSGYSYGHIGSIQDWYDPFGRWIDDEPMVGNYEAPHFMAPNDQVESLRAEKKPTLVDLYIPEEKLARYDPVVVGPLYAFRTHTILTFEDYWGLNMLIESRLGERVNSYDYIPLHLDVIDSIEWLERDKANPDPEVHPGPFRWNHILAPLSTEQKIEYLHSVPNIFYYSVYD